MTVNDEIEGKNVISLPESVYIQASQSWIMLMCLYTSFSVSVKVEYNFRLEKLE